nr:transglycosylase domain-containing protein [Niabella hibiscisoli]
MSVNAGLAVIASEDQLFPDHNGFDWKSIQKALDYNQRKPGAFGVVVPSASKRQKMFFFGKGAVGYEKALKPILLS